MVEFVKWLKSLHFSVGGSGSDSNTVEQSERSQRRVFNTCLHECAMDGFKTTLCNYFTLKHHLQKHFVLQCYGLSHSAPPSLVSGLCNFRFTVHKYLRQYIRYSTNYQQLDQILWWKRPLVDLSQLSVIPEFCESSL